MRRAGELTPIYVPNEHDEAIRDLVRTRDDAIIAQRKARQQLKALLLRNEIRYVGKSSWTAAHRRWLTGKAGPWQQCLRKKASEVPEHKALVIAGSHITFAKPQQLASKAVHGFALTVHR